LVEIIR
jgi:hypothetical protein